MLFFWLETTTIATENALRFNNIYPKWTFLLLIPLVFFYVYSIYQKEKGVGPFARNILILLRVAVILSLFVLIFEPVLERTESKIQKSIVLLLVDDSLSMSLKDNYASEDETLRENLLKYFNVSASELTETKRMDLVNKILQRDKNWYKQLDEQADLKVFRFSDALSPNISIGNVNAQGRKTALGDSIMEALKDFRGKTVASMVLITDGGSNSGEVAPEEAVKLLRERNIPLYILGVGDPEEPKDLWIASVDASKIIYEREIFTADIAVNHSGMENRRVQVYLKLQDSLLESKEVVLGDSNQPQSVQISHQFRDEGVYNLTIEVQEQSEERILVNNRYAHRLEVLNKRIKILYLEGYPRWEYRYLKNALIRDKMMEVYCFLFSADSMFPQEISKDLKEGLKGFPTEEELATYDVILFGDVDPNDSRLSQEQKKSIVNFVEYLGGGIAFIAGPRDMPRRYTRELLEKLFPVVIPNEFSESEPQIITESFQPRLTHLGLTHPILRLLPDVEKNKQLIEKDLPGFFWHYKVERAKPGAQELLVHPKQKDETHLQKPIPLMVTQIYGTGRTLFMGIDSTWRWRYVIGDKYFYNFWVQAIRYLSKGRLSGENKRYLLEIDRQSYHVGEQVQISLRVLDIKFKPSDAKTQEVYLDQEIENSGKLSGKPVKIELKPDKNRPGYFIGSYLLSEEGSYKIWAVTGATQGKENEVSQRFYASFPIIEFENPQMAEKRLRELGEFYYPHQVEEMVQKIKTPSIKYHINTISEELWDKWYNLILFALLISCEWVLRKMNKLL